jgi:hypothetical protein
VHPTPVRRDAGGVPTAGLRVWFTVFVAVLARPRLWGTALRQWFRCVPEHWWRRAPHLPIPPREYVRFRLGTAYGHGGRVGARDVVEYLEWCRSAEPPRRLATRR